MTIYIVYGHRLIFLQIYIHTHTHTHILYILTHGHDAHGTPYI